LYDDVDIRLHLLANTEANQLSLLIKAQVDLLNLLANNDQLEAALEARTATYQGNSDAISDLLTERDVIWREAEDDTTALIQGAINNAGSDPLREFSRNFPAHKQLFATDAYGGNVA